MITIIGTNPRPTNYEGASHKEDVVVLNRPEIEEKTGFNICKYQCAYVEPVFSEQGAIVDDYKNDVTDKLFDKLVNPIDTVVITLMKCDVTGGDDIEVSILNDNTYGI